MNNLLREYIHQILIEAKIKDVNVIPGQVLSIIAEHAVIQGLGGDDSFAKALEDILVSPYFEQLKGKGVDHRTYKSLMEVIYNDCVSVVAASLTDLGIEQIKVTGGNVGSTTAKVDVIVTGQTNAEAEPIEADVHVKFNDFARLIGLQADAAEGKIVLSAKKLAGDLEKTWPAAARYKFLRNRFITLSTDYGGMGFKPPKRKKGENEISAITRYGSKKELAILQKPAVRSRFLDYLRNENLPKMILKEVKAFFASKGKAAYFYKFRTRPEIVDVTVYGAEEGPAVELVVDKVIARAANLSIVENLHQTPDDEGSLKYKYGSTCLYILQYKNQDAFYIEARTSGTKHPMQIKMVPGADFKNIFVESEYEIVIS